MKDDGSKAGSGRGGKSGVTRASGAERGNAYRLPGVVAVEISENAKLGLGVSATYAAKVSCPTGCSLYDSGCYADYGPVGILWRRLGDQAAGGRLTVLGVARNEAEVIGRLSGSFDLRLHVAGDSRTRRGTRLISAACARFSRRKGKKAWGYTHAWSSVPREDWGDVSVLASCESLEGVERAAARGYAAALVIAKYEEERAYAIGGGWKLVPCPWQTRKVPCVECRLCMRDETLLARKLVIGFEAHGSGRKSALRSLPVV